MRPTSPPAAAQGAIDPRAFALGIIAGLLGGLCLTWLLGPLNRANTEPHQLRTEDRHHYLAAVALEFQHSGNIAGTFQRLLALRPAQDPFQMLAEAACALGSSGYLQSTGGIAAIRAMNALTTAQGRSGCAEQLLPQATLTRTPAQSAPTARPALPAPPTKTAPPARPSPTAAPAAIQTPPRRFSGLVVNSFCDAAQAGLIEVAVIDARGQGIPAQRIRVRWTGGESLFASGLKAERGDGYADFQMRADVAYTIDMPAAADALPTVLRAESCTTTNGAPARQSYRIAFRQIN